MSRNARRHRRESRLSLALAHGLSMLAVLLVLHVGLLHIWGEVLRHGTAALGLQAEFVQAVIQPGFKFSVPTLSAAENPPGNTQALIIAALCALIFALSFRLRPNLRGTAQILRGLCVLQGAALAWVFWMGVLPGQSLNQHGAAISTLSLGALYFMPIPLALCFGAIGLAPVRTWQCGALILFTIAILVPMQLLGHAVVVAYLSDAILPTLFIIGGPLLTALTLQALIGYCLANFGEAVAIKLEAANKKPQRLK